MKSDYLIISFVPLAEKLQKLLTYSLGRENIQTLNLPHWLFNDDEVFDIKEYDELLNNITSHLERYTYDSLRNLTVLFTIQIDIPNISDKTQKYYQPNWNPLLYYEANRGKALPRYIFLSWLVLSYPEVNWIFISEKSPRKLNSIQLLMNHLLPINLKHDYHNIIGYYQNPIFDPSGLRGSIKNTLLFSDDLSFESNNINDIRRVNLSVSIEDEEEYAIFHGYIDYKLGYRCILVRNEQMMKYLFNKVDNKDQGMQYQLSFSKTFEDIFLNFPDRSGTVHYSNLAERDNNCPKLKDINDRIFVTVGHKHVPWYRENREYLRELKSQGKNIKLIYKPSGGVYNVLNQSGFLKRYWRRKKNEREVAINSLNYSIDEFTVHSAPGRLLVIAENLIDRTKKILNKADSVQDCIHAATLSLEAKELISYRTPTTSLEALALQHEAEIMAESMFYGIEYNINVNERLIDIKKEVKAISNWFHSTSKKRSEINARLNIVERLAKRFREMNQFEEEQACLAEARKLRFEFWMRQKSWRWAAWPFLKYIEQALYSLPRFFLLILGWIIFFGVSYYFIDQTCGERGGFFEAFTASMRPFFAAEPSREWVDMSLCVVGWNLFKSFQGLVSLFNLTLLIAHIYLLVSRR